MDEYQQSMFGGFGFLTRSDTNQAVQSQRMVGGLKFRTKEEEGLYTKACISAWLPLLSHDSAHIKSTLHVLRRSNKHSMLAWISNKHIHSKLFRHWITGITCYLIWKRTDKNEQILIQIKTPRSAFRAKRNTFL